MWGALGMIMYELQYIQAASVINYHFHLGVTNSTKTPPKSILKM